MELRSAEKAVWVDKGTECPRGQGKEQERMWKLTGSSRKPWGDEVRVVGKSDA